MTGNISENPLPDSESDEELANNFADFFIDKLQRIREFLEHYPKYDPRKSTTRPKEVLSQFREVSEDEVKKIINRMATKSCVSDPIPTSPLKQILTAVISTITKIMNVSLRNGIFASNWKTAIVKPLLKKLGLLLVLSNFRPVSNLPFLAKVLEKCALVQLDEHCKVNTPIPDYQSAYREHYSCETALAKLVNDLLWSMEKGCVTSFVAIDLLAAFDTVSHDILLDLLDVRYGVIGKALEWFELYTNPRYFKMKVNGASSKPISLEYSVPQCSCLGPVAYLLYPSYMEEVIASPEPHTPALNNPKDRLPTAEKIDLHGYADEHGIKKSLNQHVIKKQQQQNC